MTDRQTDGQHCCGIQCIVYVSYQCGNCPRAV